jgi:hypothetical protein
MKRTSCFGRLIRISGMSQSIDKLRSALGALWVCGLALLLSAAGCGDLDERDTDPPSVKAVVRWDASHVLALRTYKENAAILDVRSGKQTGELRLDRYYNDIESLQDGMLVAVHNQWIDFVGADARVDPSRSIAGTVFGGIAVSADHATLAYSDYGEPTKASFHVTSLVPGVERVSPPGTYDNASNGWGFDGFALSRDGGLLAFVAGDAGLARTFEAPPSDPQMPATASCVLSQSPSLWSAAGTVAFSPTEDKLAVATVGDQIEIFDVSNYPACRSLLVIPARDAEGFGELLRYSPDGTILALARDDRAKPLDDGNSTLYFATVELFDVTTGALLREIVTYESERANDAPFGVSVSVHELLWSVDGRQLTVVGSGGPVQQWDVETGTLLWQTKL